MSLEKSTMPLSSKQIAMMYSGNKFDFGHIVQRGLVWENTRKSKLIESMLLGYPIPQVYCRRDKDESSNKKGNSTYVVLDGQQRLTTISTFINDEWTLTGLGEFVYDLYDGNECIEELSGKKFSELTEELQDRIKDTHISFVCFENITFEEERELFKRLNAGKPLSTKSRVLANCADLENILNNLGGHDLFKEMMTENSLKQKNQVSVIMKMWTMLNKDIKDVSFESKYLNAIVEDTIVRDDQKDQLLDLFDYIQEVHEYMLATDSSSEIKKLAKKFYTETHLVSLVPFIEKARIAETSADSFSDIMIKVLGELADNDSYNNASLNGSAKAENIQIRNREIEAVFSKYFG